MYPLFAPEPKIVDIMWSRRRLDTWLDIYDEFNDLSKEEKIALFEAMKQDLFPEEPGKIKK